MGREMWRQYELLHSHQSFADSYWVLTFQSKLQTNSYKQLTLPCPLIAADMSWVYFLIIIHDWLQTVGSMYSSLQYWLM